MRPAVVGLIGAFGVTVGAFVPYLVGPWCSCRRRCRAMTGGLCVLLFVVMSVRFDDVITVLAHWVLVVGLVAATTVDIRVHRLPREISYATLAVGAPLLVLAAHIAGEDHRIITALLGAASALAIMGLFHFVSRGGLGDGDVRFSPLLGAYTGWSGMADVVDGLFLGFALGAVFGVTLMAVGRAGRRTALPFGPFLAAGALLAIVLPVQIVINR